MKVVVAPDSFKDALRADAAALHIANGVRRVVPDAAIELVPIADGGEGFADAIARGVPGSASTRVSAATDPLGRPIEARWVLVHGDGRDSSAVIELAAASGLERLGPNERDPMQTSTYGTGLLIREALDCEATQLLIGIGGSATNDAGCGIAQALGVRFFDADDRLIESPIAGGDLVRIAKIDTDSIDARVHTCGLRIACDVRNPLSGPDGAAHVYGPQKGATAEQVEQLDAGLRHLARLWRDQLGIDIEQMPGAGAAGGVGGGLVAMLGAELLSGAELVFDAIGFDQRIAGADLVITGEGRLDGQSLQGKAAIAVARRAKAAGLPCVALVGSVGEGAHAALDQGLKRYLVIGEGLSPEESIRRTGELLDSAAARLTREELD